MVMQGLPAAVEIHAQSLRRIRLDEEVTYEFPLRRLKVEAWVRVYAFHFERRRPVPKERPLPTREIFLSFPRNRDAGAHYSMFRI